MVAAGRHEVAAVLADPLHLRTRLWDDGEALLYVADGAAGEDVATAVSYETGSNVAHWPSLSSN